MHQCKRVGEGSGGQVWGGVWEWGWARINPDARGKDASGWGVEWGMVDGVEGVGFVRGVDNKGNRGWVGSWWSGRAVEGQGARRNEKKGLQLNLLAFGFWRAIQPLDKLVKPKTEANQMY
jgi:hypothetical protein